MATTPTAVAVHTAFGSYTRGQVIKDPATVAEILGSNNASNVHRLSIPATPPSITASPTAAAELFEHAVDAAEAELHPKTSA